MKTKMILMLMLAVVAAVANDDRYTEQMTKNIEAVYKAQTPEQYQQCINMFERIGNAEKTKWEPYYYASFGYLMQATNAQEGAKKDQLLDLAASALAKGKALNENESEIVALEGFIHMIRVTVDPATRGSKFSGLAMQAFGKAAALNPENPRALAFMAQMQFGTARFFNQQPTEACATVDKALEKFATFRPQSPLAPQWGKSMAEGLKQQCQ